MLGTKLAVQEAATESIGVKGKSDVDGHSNGHDAGTRVVAAVVEGTRSAAEIVDKVVVRVSEHPYVN